MTDVNANYKQRRDIFMQTFGDDINMQKRIPEIAAGIFNEEFGINIYDLSHIPIVFVEGWTQILKYVGEQKTDEFAIDVCGISLEYVTEYSESDKCTNIVPQMVFRKAPIFSKQNHQATTGSSFTNDLLARYNSWRSVNLEETMDKIERDIYATVLNEYGINLMVSATIFPLMAAAFVAGLQLARESKETINMYNIFYIDVLEDDQVILTPQSTVKQYLKNDSKQN